MKELPGNRSHATRKSVHVPFRQSRIFKRCTLVGWAAGLNMRVGVHGTNRSGRSLWSNCEMPMQMESVRHHGSPLCDNTFAFTRDSLNMRDFLKCEAIKSRQGWIFFSSGSEVRWQNGNRLLLKKTIFKTIFYQEAAGHRYQRKLPIKPLWLQFCGSEGKKKKEMLKA